jgi:hypothetical protein
VSDRRNFERFESLYVFLAPRSASRKEMHAQFLSADWTPVNQQCATRDSSSRQRTPIVYYAVTGPRKSVRYEHE